MTGPLCRKCGSRLQKFLTDAGMEYHVNCAPPTSKYNFGEPDRPGETNGDPYAGQLRDELTDIIRWADRRSPRSQQTEIGASEIGGECLRRIGYRLADIPPANTGTDPWPAIVGTAVHSWLEKAMRRWEADRREGRWHTEMTVHPSDAVMGHTDLYDAPNAAVIDYKTVGTEKMQAIRKHGDEAIPADNKQQVHLYGLGHVRAGRPVRRVALVFLPRGGWLSGMYVWSAAYDQAVAEAALDRVNRVAAGLIHYGVMETPENWVRIPATPEPKSCSWCPWFNAGVDTASAAGCPGK